MTAGRESARTEFNLVRSERNRVLSWQVRLFHTDLWTPAQARVLGMLSPWLQRMAVRLTGSTFEHCLYDMLTDADRQPALAASVRDLRFTVGITSCSLSTGCHRPVHNGLTLC